MPTREQLHNARLALAKQMSVAQEELMVQRCLASPMYWLRHGTRTIDEQDVNSRKPFPNYKYFDYVAREMIMRPPKGESNIVAAYKSRTMMMSWLSAGLATWIMGQFPDTRVVIQSKDEKRAKRIVDKAKTLYVLSNPRIKARWPVPKDPYAQAETRFEYGNGSSMEAFASGPDTIRFEHGTIYGFDEASLEDELDECVANALAAKTPHIWLIASAKPGPLNEKWKTSKQVDWPEDPAIENDETTVRIIDNTPLSHVDMGMLAIPSEVRQPMLGLSKHISPEGWKFLRVHYSCDPSMRDEEKLSKVAKVFGGRNSPLWKREMEIDAEAMGGALVHPKYDESIHVVEDKDIPEEGCLFMSIDPHPRTEHAMLWVLVDKYDDIWVYREFWPSDVYGTGKRVTDDTACNNFTVRRYAEYIAFIEGNDLEINNRDTSDEYGIYRQREDGEYIICRYMDQAGKGFKINGEGQPEYTIARRYSDYGISAADPIKSHQVGNDLIDGYLEPRELHALDARLLAFNGNNRCRPRIHIARSLAEIRAEFRNHRFTESTSSAFKELSQRPSQFRTHMLDNLRYLLSSNLYYSHQSFSRRVTLAMLNQRAA